MKSKLNTLEDFQNAPVDWEVTLPDPEMELEKKLKSLTRSRKKTEKTDLVEKGTVTMITVESVMEKFNKPMIPVTIGGGLYNLELEEQLIGKKAGETFEVTVMDQPVKVTIRSATKTIFPKPTDDDVKKFVEGKEEYQGIETLEDYKKFVTESYIEEEKNNAVQDKVQEITDYVLSRSTFTFDEEEVAEEYQELLLEADAEAKETCGKSYKDLTDEELQKYFEVENKEAFEATVREGIEQEIAFVLWVASLKGKNLQEVHPGDEECYDISMIEEYVKEKIQFQ